MRADIRGDAITTVVRGFYLAVPLAFLALCAKLAGWYEAAWAALPMYAAYQAGRMASQDKEMREFEERLRRLSEKSDMDGGDDP